MKLKIGIALAGLLIALIGGGLWVAQSDWLREKVLTEIVTQAEKTTGGAVKLQAFHFDWRSLTAEVDGFEIRGTEPLNEAPLLTVEKIRVGLTIVSLVSRDIRVAWVEADHPSAHLILLGNGKTNIPEPKLRRKNMNAAETILDLKIGKFTARNGEFLLAEKTYPWEASGQNLAAQIAYESGRSRYSGNVSLGSLRVNGYNIALTARAAMEVDRIVVQDATVRSGESEVRLRNTMMHHFSSPEWTGQYEGTVSLREFLKGAQGNATFAGSGRFVSIKDYQASGTAKGSGVQFGYLRNSAIAAEFDAAPERISVKRASVRTLGGEITTSGELTDFRIFKASGRFEHFDLAEIAALQSRQKLPYDGQIAGMFRVEGSFRQQKGEVQLAISPAKASTPVNGNVTLTFDTAARRVEFGNSSVNLPHTHLEISGALGGRLEVNASSSDPADVLPFLPEKTKPNLGWASATFHGTVTGPPENPEITGSATGKAVKFEQYSLDSVSGDFVLNQRRLTVSGASAVYQGIPASASGSIGLIDWRVSAQSAIAATVKFERADPGKFVNVPVTGALSGLAQISGTFSAPVGSADVTLGKGLIYGQPYDSVSGKVEYLNKNAQTFNGVFVSGPKRVSIITRFNQPETLEFNLTSNTMPLNEIAMVRERQPDIHGFGKFHADGAARIHQAANKELQIDLLRINADASANSLELGGRNLGDARFIATTAASAKGSIISARFDSNAAKASIHGEGTIGLTSEYPVSGTVQFSNAGLNALTALVLKADEAANLNLDGTLEGQIQVAGPLSKPDRLTAKIDIPNVEVHPLAGSDFARNLPNFSLTNNGPIRATLSKSVLNVESARMKAPQTDISVSGSVDMGQTGGALNLKTQGNINLAMVRSFAEDVTSTGVLSLDGTIRGTFNTPDVSGRAVMRNGEFHYADFANGLTNMNGEILFNGTRATIQTLSAESGGGKVDATGFAAYAGGRLTFRIEAKARSVRVRYPEGVSSISDADLNLAGTPERSNVSGTVTVHRVAINPKSDAATILAASAQPLKTASAKNGFASNVNLDVQIATASDVAFQTSVTQSLEADATLRLRGTLTNPALLGRINVTQGEIVFFGNKYSINQGTISFFNAAKIEPVLNVDLETKARGVEVVLTLSGPLTKLNVSYRSDPPLQFSDIVALLATGRTPSDPTLAIRDSGQSQSFQQLGADTLIGQAIANPVAGRLQRFFGVSRIKIDPQLTGITGSPQARLTIEQQVTPEILFTYITDVSSTSTQLIRVEWAFNKNWSAILIREENGYVGLDFAFKKRFR